MEPVPGYHLMHLLGTGAFSEVWQARGGDDRHVALKFLDCRRLSPSVISGEVKLLRSLSALNHAHIVPLLGVHPWGKYLILMLELAHGSLDDLHKAYLETTGRHVP